MSRPVFVICGSDLLHENFLSLVALTTDIEAVFGVGYAYALQVEVFNSAVVIADSNVVDAVRRFLIEGDRSNHVSCSCFIPYIDFACDTVHVEAACGNIYNAVNVCRFFEVILSHHFIYLVFFIAERSEEAFNVEKVEAGAVL